MLPEEAGLDQDGLHEFEVGYVSFQSGIEAGVQENELLLRRVVAIALQESFEVVHGQLAVSVDVEALEGIVDTERWASHDFALAELNRFIGFEEGLE